MKKITFIYLVFLAISAPALLASPEQEESLKTAKKFLAMDPVTLKAEVENLNANQAAELISQIRYLVKENNPDLDKIYPVLEHLASLKAAELEQKRLNNLLLVIGVIILLFSIYLTYILFDQRKSIAKMQLLLSTETENKVKKKEVYRGG